MNKIILNVGGKAHNVYLLIAFIPFWVSGPIDDVISLNVSRLIVLKAPQSNILFFKFLSHFEKFSFAFSTFPNNIGDQPQLVSRRQCDNTWSLVF